MTALSDLQQDVCGNIGAQFLVCDHSLKIELAEILIHDVFPSTATSPTRGRNGGMVHLVGRNLSDAPDFFVPLHAIHLHERCPEILKYLGLAPGWRFLIAPGYEDVCMMQIF
jgi:hypothetical protein